MDQYVHRNILENVMEPYVAGFLLVTWNLMHDNNPKKTARTVKQWLEEKQIRMLEWPVQSSDLNSTENLWGDVEVVIQSKSPATLDELWNTIEEAWHNIPVERCQELVKSAPKRSAACKGFPTKC
ncbi:hypothetical protein Trydic_g23593 [Trypoxylus dichotomus]